jgi:hypothetical protein
LKAICVKAFSVKPAKTFASLALFLGFLAACGGPIPDNALSIDNDGDGKFSGYAGPDWTVDEIRREVATGVCGGKEPAAFLPRLLDGKHLFSGSC